MILKHQHFELLKKTVLERVVFKPPLMINGSMHDEACFLYAVQGQSSLYAPSGTEALSSSEGVVMKCGSYLNRWHVSEETEECEAIAVHFYPEVLQLVYENDIPSFLKQSERTAGVFIEKVAVDHMIGNYVESLQFYFENPSLVNDELVVLKVKELILLLVNTDDSLRIRNILQDLFRPERYSFKEIIEKNLFEDLDLENLAVLTSMSVSSFKRKFKEIYSKSPARYIKERRLSKAAELLEVSSKRISDICFDCGFNDLAHFSKSFMQQFGASPTEYRASLSKSS
jgi:AraC-like DNA-binding protein